MEFDVFNGHGSSVVSGHLKLVLVSSFFFFFQRYASLDVMVAHIILDVEVADSP